MMDANTRKIARELESFVVGRIATKRAINVAAKVGVNSSQITRWQEKDGLVSKACALFAAIDFNVPDGTVIFQGEDTAMVAQMLTEMLAHIREPKNKAPAATEAI